MNEPARFQAPKQIIFDQFEDKEVTVELRYSGEKQKIKLRLSSKILFLKIKAKLMIDKEDGDFDPKEHEILLMYRGKTMLDETFLGNYV